MFAKQKTPRSALLPVALPALVFLLGMGPCGGHGGPDAGMDAGTDLGSHGDLGSHTDLRGRGDLGAADLRSGADLGAGPDGGSTSLGCKSGVWRWENPLPQGYDLLGVWGSGPKDVWAVGRYGTLVHYDGTALSAATSPTSADLYALWGSAANNIWAVGDHVILHYDGTTWTVAQSPAMTFLAAYGTGPSDVYAVGQPTGGTRTQAGAFHYDGTSWQPDQSGLDPSAVPLTGVWESGPGAPLYVVPIAYLNAGAPHGGDFRTAQAISGTATDDIWLLSNDASDTQPIKQIGRTLSFNFAPGAQGLVSVWARTRTDAWAVGSAPVGTGIQHWNGTNWVAVDNPIGSGFTAVWADSATDVWMVGAAGIVLHYDGTAFTVLTRGPLTTLNAVWASSATDAWAAGAAGTLLHSNGATWTQQPSLSGTVTGLWGSGPKDVWAVGDTIWHYDGTAWTTAAGAPHGGPLAAVWGSGPADVWAVALDSAFHFPGGMWTGTPLAGYALTGVWGSGPADVWAISAGNGVLHYDGTGWMLSYPTSDHQTAIWGSGPNDVWAMDSIDGVDTLHYDGTAWSPASSKGAASLSGTGPSDIFAAQNGIFRFDGSTWSLQFPLGNIGDTPTALNGVFVLPTGGAWAVGQAGAILHCKD